MFGVVELLLALVAEVVFAVCGCCAAEEEVFYWEALDSGSSTATVLESAAVLVVGLVGALEGSVVSAGVC